jgi:hypothetical protein
MSLKDVVIRYDSEDSAKGRRSMFATKGISCGTAICVEDPMDHVTFDTSLYTKDEMQLNNAAKLRSFRGCKWIAYHD